MSASFLATLALTLPLLTEPNAPPGSPAGEEADTGKGAPQLELKHPPAESSPPSSLTSLLTSRVMDEGGVVSRDLSPLLRLFLNKRLAGKRLACKRLIAYRANKRAQSELVRVALQLELLNMPTRLPFPGAKAFLKGSPSTNGALFVSWHAPPTALGGTGLLVVEFEVSKPSLELRHKLVLLDDDGIELLRIEDIKFP